MIIKYSLGRIEINPRLFRLESSNAHDSSHKFLVTQKENELSLWTAVAENHEMVGYYLKLLELTPFKEFRPKDKSYKIIGGGSVYVLQRGKIDHLVIGDYSGTFDSIPNYAADIFGKSLIERLSKIKTELKNSGINIEGFVSCTDESKLNEFWRNINQS